MTTISADSVIVNDGERAESVDQNRHGEYIGNTIAEVLHMLAAEVPFSAGNADTATLLPISVPRVIGLALQTFNAGPRTITIGGGCLINNTGAEANQVGFSIWRIGQFATGHLEAVADTAIPAADNLWYLLEARVTGVTIQENRDILTNPVTRTYTPQLVNVISQKKIIFNVKVGGASIPAPTIGWTPLYGFLNAAVVDLTRAVDFRQPLRAASTPRAGLLTGGALAAADTEVTHRRIWTEAAIRTAAGAGGLNSNRIAFDIRAVVDGLELAVATTPGSYVQTASFCDTGAMVANRFHYLYLAPLPVATWGEMRRVGNYHRGVNGTLDVRSTGILIISTQAPSADTQRNTVALTIPAPLSGNIAIGRAACVGAIFYGPTGWTPTWASGNEFRHQAMVGAVPFASGFNGNATHVLQFAYGDPITQPFYPINVARHVSLQVGFSTLTPTQGAAGAGGKLLCTFGPPFGQVAYEVNPNEPTVGSLLVDPLIQEQWQSVDVPVGLEDFGAAQPTAAGPGYVYVNLATRQSDGTPWVGAPNGQMLDVCQAGVVFGLRCTGWRM